MATKPCPYTDRFNDLYTETKVAAEKFVLARTACDGMLTCSIRPSGIWGRGDQTMFRKVFESVLAGHVKVLVGSKHVKLDNSYVHNLIHGFILAAEHLVPGGTAPGQAYFVNDGEPINMFEFARPVVRGLRTAVAAVPGARQAGAPRDDGLAVAALPVRSAQAAAGTPCRGAAVSRQLLLDRQGPPRSRLSSRCSRTETGAGRMPAVLRRVVPHDEAGRQDQGTAPGGFARPALNDRAATASRDVRGAEPARQPRQRGCERLFPRK